jgi:hypothetical protein
MGVVVLDGIMVPLRNYLPSHKYDVSNCNGKPTEKCYIIFPCQGCSVFAGVRKCVIYGFYS